MLKIVLFCLIVNSAVYGQTAKTEWKGIQPLLTSKADIEKKFGKPINETLNLYDTSSERVTVWYSSGLCTESPQSKWNVSRDTVVGFLVAPKGPVPVQSVLETLRQKFEKAVDPEMKDRFVYESSDGSIMIDAQRVTDGSEQVVVIVYTPGISNSSLRCPDRK